MFIRMKEYVLRMLEKNIKFNYMKKKFLEDSIPGRFHSRKIPFQEDSREKKFQQGKKKKKKCSTFFYNRYHM